MPISSTAAQAGPSARVLAGSSAVLRAKLGALVGFVVAWIVSSCLWAGYPVDLISQHRKLERSISYGHTTIPLPALLGIPVTSMTSLLREEMKRRTGCS